MPIVQPVIVPFEGDAKDLERKIDALNRDFDKFAAHTKSASTASVSAAKSSGTAWTEFRSAYSTVLEIARAGQQVWQATGGEFVALAEQVKNTSRSLGASAEEASRLIQVADDVRIGQQSLKMAFKEAQKDGIEPNIDGLAALSDKYLSLPPGIKRTQFAIEVFGSKAGPEMEKLLVKGGSAIRKYASEIDDSLIITDDAIKASDDYQASLDQLNDAFYGIKVSLGQSLMPAMIAAESVILADIKAVQTFDDVLSGSKSIDDWSAGIINAMPAFTLFGVTIGKIKDDVPETSDAIEENTDALDGQKEAIDAAKDALKDYESQLEAVSKANLDMESMSRTIAKDQKKYAEDHADAIAKVRQAEEDLFMVRENNEGKSEGEIQGAIGEATNALFDARKAVGELEATWHESAENMIYDMVLVGLSAGGLLDSEQKALDEYAVKAGIKTQADIDEANRRREIADATIAGILQSEDVLAEQRRIDAETLRLTEAQTSAESLAAAAEQVNAINGVSESINSATQSYIAMAAAAYKTAAAAKSIPGAGGGSSTPPELIHSRDSGGAGIAGTPYMIRVPEVFVAPTNGTFIPLGGASAKDIGGKGDTIYNFYITNPVPEKSDNAVRKALKLAVYTSNFA